jgi:hypothetical protein
LGPLGLLLAGRAALTTDKRDTAITLMIEFMIMFTFKIEIIYFLYDFGVSQNVVGISNSI